MRGVSPCLILLAMYFAVMYLTIFECILTLKKFRNLGKENSWEAMRGMEFDRFLVHCQSSSSCRQYNLRVLSLLLLQCQCQEYSADCLK